MAAWILWCFLALLVPVLVRLYHVLTIVKVDRRSGQKLDGKTVIITGGNSGIGLETVRELAWRGARIIVACRDVVKAESLMKDIRKETDNQLILVKSLDVSSLASIRQFAEDIKKTERRLDILINNAGVGGIKPRTLTKDGLEITFATNHFGPFLLTNLLLDLLKASAPSRVVNVASLAHIGGKIEFDNLNSEKHFGATACYCNSKLAHILFTKELARRLDDTGVKAYCCHPGAVATNLFRHLPWYLRPVFELSMRFFKNAEEGAQTQIYLSVSENIGSLSGKYFDNCSVGWTLPSARDMGNAKKLWEISERLTGLS